MSYAPEVLYASEIGLRSVNALRPADHGRCAELAQRRTLPRERQGSDAAVLSAPPPPAPTSSGFNAYLIGKCLLDRRDRRALRHVRMAVRERPTGVRPWLALAWAAAVHPERPWKP